MLVVKIGPLSSFFPPYIALWQLSVPSSSQVCAVQETISSYDKDGH